MLGAIAGDMIGSVYEWHPVKKENFPLWSAKSKFTDDTVLTVAVASAILSGGDYAQAIKTFAVQYPNYGYGSMFEKWIHSSNSEPYNSWGNGSAMRVGPVGFAFDSEEDVLKEARRSAEVTHNHPEGIKGAQATALAIYRARNGASKFDIRQETSARFGYDLARTVAAIRPSYRFNESCQETVPEALICFFEGESIEDTIRKAVSLGGDADTLACIAGSVAEAFYGTLPHDLQRKLRALLTPDLLQVVDAFYGRFMKRGPLQG
jgi:ADP-ribosylglycohydrolase